MDINLENKPKALAICLNEKCLLSEKCLRFLVARNEMDEHNILSVVNHTKFNETNCEYFLENKKVRVAYGMKGSFEEVKAKDIADMRRKLMQHFGHTYYYERRNGKMPITPEDQEYIAKLFKSYGYEIVFDEIREETLWR